VKRTIDRDLDRDTFVAEVATLTGFGETFDVEATMTFVPERPPRREPGDRVVETLPGLAVGSVSTAEGRPAIEVIGTLGEGGMGIVHLARQVALDRDVAVKTPRSGRGRDAAAELLREAWVTGALEHPNIVPVYTLGVDDSGAPQIVMKRIEGTLWWDDREPSAGAGPEQLERDLDILLDVCSAVRFAHSRGVVHRDIKPQNVMIGHFDEVYLLDWGLAVRLDDDATATQGGLAGTPGFMAPEMALGVSDEVDERTDVYLLGSTLHWVLTGECRHAGDTVFEVLYAAWESRPHTYGPEVPAELGEIANRACARASEDRYQSVDEFRDALRNYRVHRESIELSHVAGERREKLTVLLSERTDADALVVHDLFGECRFGFRQALRMWPRNEHARSGLQEVLEAMLDYHIEQENLVGARKCLNDLPHSNPELSSRVRSLEARLAREAENLERLKALEESYDLQKGMLSRSRLAALLAVVWTTTTAHTAWTETFGGVTPVESMNNHVHAGLRNVVIVAAAMVIFRRRLFVNRANGLLIYALFAMVCTVALLRASAWWLHADIVMARAADDAVFGLTALMVGLMSDSRVTALSLIFFGGLVLGVAWPDLQVWSSAAVNLLFFGGLAWIWRARTS
jgi:serine/threonine-protein kinase